MQVNIKLVEALFMDLLADDWTGIAELQQNRLSGGGEDDAAVSLAFAERYRRSAAQKRKEAKKCKIICDLASLHSWPDLKRSFRDRLIELGVKK